MYVPTNHLLTSQTRFATSLVTGPGSGIRSLTGSDARARMQKLIVQVVQLVRRNGVRGQLTHSCLIGSRHRDGGGPSGGRVFNNDGRRRADAQRNRDSLGETGVVALSQGGPPLHDPFGKAGSIASSGRSLVTLTAGYGFTTVRSGGAGRGERSLPGVGESSHDGRVAVSSASELVRLRRVQAGGGAGVVRVMRLVLRLLGPPFRWGRGGDEPAAGTGGGLSLIHI